ncbi:uncharacterized protein JCM6883_000992 [Sporobolomyces salmoneus]|uniref:uncharacterized protein n=1 Tax=Sporobolomyces salmoneus TaxID=183962 RepID=UPI003170EB7E
MSQQLPYPYNASFPPTNSTSTSNSTPSSSHRPVKPEPMPLQHHQQAGSTSSSSLSSGYHSSSTSEQSHHQSNLQGNNTNGAAALLQQQQANQHAFRTGATPHFVFQNQSGPSPFDPSRQGFDHPSRESSTSSSTKGSEAGPSRQESDYDPFRIKHRRRTSPPQLKILEHHFEVNPKPDVATRKVLSEQLDMTPREVQVWFQNRRAKVKKLKERADREAVSSSREGNSPPDAHFDEKPQNVLSASAAELPNPSNVFPGPQPYPSGPQPYPSRTIYGHDVVSQRRTSPPATAYPQMHYPHQPQAGPSALAPQPHLSPSSDPSLLHSYAAPGAYQSTIYTTTVASSTYATNEFIPGPHSAPTHPDAPPYPLLAHDPYAGRRYSLPVLSGGNEPSPWSNTSADPLHSSDGYPAYQPPSSSAFASSSLATSLSPGSIDGSSHPSYPSYSFAPPPSSVGAPYHDRRGSYVSDSMGYDSSADSHVPVSAGYEDPTSSYLPSQAPAASDPFSSFDPLAPPPPMISPAPFEDSMVSPPGSRLVERRASMAHRQTNRLKPYDPNERRSPSSGSHSPHSQSQ